MVAAALARYRWSGSALLRATTASGGPGLPEDLYLHAEQFPHTGVAWLREVWRSEDLRAGLHIASPSLCAAIEHVVDAGPPRDLAAVRRTVLSVGSYLLRRHGRPTPFGLFAGVAGAHVGNGVRVRWSEDHRVALRPDAVWLGEVVARLHEEPRLRDRLFVVANNTATLRGDRLVAPGRASPEDATGLAPLEVSVRATPPVRAVLEAAVGPIRYGDLRDLLGRRFPVEDPGRIDAVLAPLLTQGLLITNLSVPTSSPDAVGHLCAALADVDAHTIPAIAESIAQLRTVRDELAGPLPIRRVRSELAQRRDSVAGVPDIPLAADTILDCDVVIPEQVAREAADAARVLLRLSPHAVGDPAWRDYHVRFRARYGTATLVPVLELVADSGLGFPAGYLGAARQRARSSTGDRDRTLLALIQQATVDGTGEIVLTEQVIDELATGDLADMQLPGRIEIAVEIHSESTHALSRGRFTVAVTGTPRPGSSMIGRHAHLVAPQHRTALADSFLATAPDTVAAQLSFPPRRHRNDNIARTDRLLPATLSLAEHHTADPDHIDLADLAVTTTGTRLELVRVSTGQRVESRVLHALQAATHMPALARFLSEITTARCAAYGAFHLGIAATLPYLPRVRYRRSILSPAQWRLQTASLPDRHAPDRHWTAALVDWRRMWRVPRHVAIVEHDRRQPVDLDHPLHRQLLRARLDRGTHLRLQETAEPALWGWLGRAHEVVFPLRLDTPAGPDSTPGSVGSVHTVAHAGGDAATESHAHLPGAATILHAQLYAHPLRFDELLTEHLPALPAALASGSDVPSWWFRRHRDIHRPDADQHLALYLRLPTPADYGPAAARVAQWAHRLRRVGLLSHLTLATYEPHPGRWGHDSALEHAHDVFAADSAAALTQITLALHNGIDATVITAASLVDLAIGFTGSTRAGLDWLITRIPREHGPLDPQLRDLALRLGAPQGQVLPSLLGGGSVVGAWQARAAALAVYREHPAPQRDPDDVLHDLVRLHHGRAIGVDPDSGRLTRRLARACALRHTADHRED